MRESEAMAVVHGTFTVSGTIHVWVNADYATYYGADGTPTVHEFRIVIRFNTDTVDWAPGQREPIDGGPAVPDPINGVTGQPFFSGTGAQGWSFERELIASTTQPAYTAVGALDFEVPGLQMASGDSVHMTLITARWSHSPQQGREDWPTTVHAEVSMLQMCATELLSPTPPPSPPSPPPSPPPPSPPPSPPPPSPPPPSPPPP